MLSTGYTFTDGDTVTPTKLNQLVNSASFTTGGPVFDTSSNLTTTVNTLGSATISSASIGTGNVGTLVFSASVAPYLNAGDLLILSGFTSSAWNGSYLVQSVSTTTVTIITTATANASVVGTAVVYSGSISTNKISTGTLTAAGFSGPISNLVAQAKAAFDASATSNPTLTAVSLTRSGTLITASKNGHGLNTGDWITIFSGSGNTANYNGSWMVLKIDNNNFKFTVTNAPAADYNSVSLYSIKNLGSWNITSIGPTTASSNGLYVVSSPAITSASVVCGIGRQIFCVSTPPASGTLTLQSVTWGSTPTSADWPYASVLIF